MDAERVLPLPWLPRRGWRTRRVQRQVHVQSVCFAWGLLRHVTNAHSQDISKLFPARKTLAIHRDSAGARFKMNHEPHRLAVVDLEPAKSDFLSEAIAGLSHQPRTLPCKYFYDENGAELFQKICELPEYYITRTETGILRLNAHQMAHCIGARSELIGLGTGSGTKTRILLEELEEPAVYVPVDISKEQLERSTSLFRKIFPELEILPVCADYLEPFDLPSPFRKAARKVVYFPGSTIGNFEPLAAMTFLRRVVDLFGNDGGLLIGVDLRKDRNVLERAYNDSAGVTAQFNLNLLARANCE